MTVLATRYREGVQAAIDRHGVPWCIVQLGARAEYHFYPVPPVSGGEAAAQIDDELDDYLHLSTLNRVEEGADRAAAQGEHQGAPRVRPPVADDHGGRQVLSAQQCRDHFANRRQEVLHDP